MRLRQDGRPLAVRGPLALAAASGALLGATFSPYGGPVLPFVAFAPLAAALAAAPDGSATRFGAAPAPMALGFATAALAHGIGLYWMIPALSWRTPLAVPVYLLLVVLLGVLGGLACVAARALGRRWPPPIALACCWTGGEWAAERAPLVSYAWLNAGDSLAWHPAAAAGVEIFGDRILTVWTVLVGGMLGAACARARLPWRALLSAFLLVALPLAAGHLRQRTLARSEPVGRVVAVQSGRVDEASGTEERLERWRRELAELVAADEPALAAVFPERYLETPLRRLDGGGATEAGMEVADLSAWVGAPVIAGALDWELAPNGRDTLWYNAAAAQPPDGAPPKLYRKRRLVPGLEGGGWLTGLFGSAATGYARGAPPAPLVVGGAVVGAMVCYDSAYGETARRLAAAGAQWLVVLSDDDWLDPDAPFRATWAYRQHATHGRLRALENRTTLVQVAATGHTFAVSGAGRGAGAALAPGEAGAVSLPVGPSRAPTVFTRVGDLLGLACFCSLLAAAALSRLHRRRRG